MSMAEAAQAMLARVSPPEEGPRKVGRLAA